MVIINANLPKSVEISNRYPTWFGVKTGLRFIFAGLGLMIGIPTKVTQQVAAEELASEWERCNKTK